MTREEVIALKERIEDAGVLQVVNLQCESAFGMKCWFQPYIYGNRLGECRLYYKDRGGLATKQVTGNPLLCRIFKSAEIEANVYWFEDKKLLEFDFRIGYSHPDGGGNGRNIGSMVIDMEKMEVVKAL